MPLATLAAGSLAMLARANLPSDQRALLSAMGLSEACTIKVYRSGQPCIVQVLSTRLALAGSVAHRILVEPVSEPGHTPGQMTGQTPG